MTTTTTKPRSRATALHAIAEADLALCRPALIQPSPATISAEALLESGLFCGQPGVRQLLPMLFEIQAMAAQVRDNRASWNDCYRDPADVDSVLEDFEVASKALVRLIQASAHC